MKEIIWAYTKHIQGFEEMSQSVKCLLHKHEDLKFPEPTPKVQADGTLAKVQADGTLAWVQADGTLVWSCEGIDRKISTSHWLATLTLSLSLRPMTGPVSKDKVDKF